MIGPFEPIPSGTGIAPPRCHPPPDGGTLRHVNNSLPGPVSEGSVHGNGSRQLDNWLLALAEPFVTVLAHGNGVSNGGTGGECQCPVGISVIFAIFGSKCPLLPSAEDPIQIDSHLQPNQTACLK